MPSPLHNIAKNVGFTRYGKVIHLPSTKAISECRLDDILNFLNNKTSSNFIQSINLLTILKKEMSLGRSPQEAGILDGYFSLFFVLVPSSLLKE